MAGRATGGWTKGRPEWGVTVAILFQAGAVLRVDAVPDRGGGNPKMRPVVLIDDFDDESAEPARGVAVTTLLLQNLDTVSVKLPFSAKRGCGTGLDKPNAAVCDWVVDLRSLVILERMGHVKTAHLRQIVLLVEALSAG